MNFVYDGENFHQIQTAFGKRPGGYTVDPFYLRKGLANKPYFWWLQKKKWVLIRLGDSFYLDDSGIPTKTGLR